MQVEINITYVKSKVVDVPQDLEAQVDCLDEELKAWMQAQIELLAKNGEGRWIGLEILDVKTGDTIYEVK